MLNSLLQTPPPTHIWTIADINIRAGTATAPVATANATAFALNRLTTN
jgi:hypothetical protein